MKKYIATFKISLQKTFTYRSVEIIWVIYSFITPLLFMQIWSKNINNVQGFDLSEIVTYYFIMTIIEILVTPHVLFNVVNNIRDGDINFSLLKPYSYFTKLFVEEIPYKFTAYLFSIVPFAFFILIYKSYIVIPSLTISKIALLIVILLLSYLLLFLIEFAIACLAFFITEVEAIIRIFFTFLAVFSGQLFPLEFMPEILKSIGNFLPFKSYWYYPSMIVIGKQELVNLQEGFLVLLFWIVFFALLVKFLWTKGIKSYTAYGG